MSEGEERLDIDTTTKSAKLMRSLYIVAYFPRAQTFIIDI